MTKNDKNKSESTDHGRPNESRPDPDAVTGEEDLLPMIESQNETGETVGGEEAELSTEETDEQPVTAKGEEETKVKEEIDLDRFLRLAAEFDNYKKRTAREFGDVVKRANFRILRELVEIIDNFERALQVDPADSDGAAYRKGVELIYGQVGDLLAKEGVTPIDSVGRPFDPNFQEALVQMESDEYDEGIVCQEAQKGYRIGDKVLRHARVIVSNGRKGRTETGDATGEKTEE